MKVSETPDRMPLGVFGGTFDPVHVGHLRLAEEAADALELSCVRWIPAGWPALRGMPRVAAAQRLDMVRLAITGNPRFVLDSAEVATAQPSYTVPTLERLRATDGIGSERSLVLLVGADAFAGMAGWHRWESLLELAHIGVAHRPGYPVDADSLPPALAAIFRARLSMDVGDLKAAPAGRIAIFAMTPLDVSATKIRMLLSNDCSTRYLLPDAVISYIRQHHLYSEN